MKEVTQLNRVNYAVGKHHRQMLREKLDPRLIQTIQVAQNPSLNYRNAFKTVYHDELEKTIQYQQEKKQQQKNSFYQPPQPQLNHSCSNPSLAYLKPTLNAFGINPDCGNCSSKRKPNFTDFDEERSKKIEGFINRGLDGGQSFFRAQDDYQKKRQQENEYNKYTLQQQMMLNQQKKQQAAELHYRQVEELKENRYRQLELEQYRTLEKKHEKEIFGEEIKQQIENERIKRGRKSQFEFQGVGRHNPITNPIEYHIDNPYILHKYQMHALSP